MGKDFESDPHSHPTRIRNLPLWRVNWTELPGHQDVLNVHQWQYRHMFRTLLAGPKPWIFGHLYLEGGTKNLNSKEYSLGDKNSKAARVGTLMRVCDYTEVEEDGRMILAVQALDRFRVIRSTPSSSGPLSYNSATVELLPDREDLGRHAAGAPASLDAIGVAKAATAASAAEGSRWRPFEFRHVTVSACLSGVSGPIGLAGFDVDASAGPAPYDSRGMSPASRAGAAAVVAEEMNLWIKIDEMIRLLVRVNPRLRIRELLPPQIVGLLPTYTPDGHDWPEGFELVGYASVLGMEPGAQFVRVSTAAGKGSYPELRRARRLSYTVWFLLEKVGACGEGTDGPGRQEVLLMRDVADRLRAASEALKGHNGALRRVLEERWTNL